MLPVFLNRIEPEDCEAAIRDGPTEGHHRGARTGEEAIDQAVQKEVSRHPQSQSAEPSGARDACNDDDYREKKPRVAERASARDHVPKDAVVMLQEEIAVIQRLVDEIGKQHAQKERHLGKIAAPGTCKLVSDAEMAKDEHRGPYSSPA